MGFRYVILYFVTLTCCSAQWENYQDNFQQITNSWYPTSSWRGHTSQQNNRISVDSQDNIQQHQTRLPANQQTTETYDVPTTNLHSNFPSFSARVTPNSANKKSLNSRSTNPPSGFRNYPSSNWESGHSTTNQGYDRQTISIPNIKRRVEVPILSHQVVKDDFSQTKYFSGKNNQNSDTIVKNYKTRTALRGRHFIRRRPQTSSKTSSNVYMDKVHGNIPAQVDITGDPTKDQKLGVQITTPEKKYDLNLQRINNDILHEDVRFLTVSVDDHGRTVFQETYKPVDLQAKAKQSHFYHDYRSGTFLSIKAQKKGAAEKPHSFIEGVLFDEMIVASPFSSEKRHKRSLYTNSHTMWKKKQGQNGVFHFDTMNVPDLNDILKMQKKTQTEPEHRRHKRQFTRSSEPRVPPRIEPELLLFVDFALFREFDGDSNELLEYLLHFWHAVNWKYLTIALSGSWPVIDLKIREIGVFKEPNAQPFIETSRIRRGSKLFSLYDAMDNLQKWLIRYENALPVHDIAFLQTGENACRRVRHNTESKIPFSPSILKTLRQGIPMQLDPKDDKECITGTAGVAYVRGACLSAPMLRGNAFNFGIGEASNSFNGVIIAAHEIGHLLGAYHDGEADAGTCSSKSGYIMSYTRDDSYKFSRFSDCSVRSFQNFLRIDRAKCLLNRSSRDTLQFPTTFPGKFMSLRQQCLRFTGGPPCEEGPTQCEHLCCDDRKGEWRYTRSEPAVDGTECSSQKVCLNGQCVPLSTIGRK